ncbi:MAG: TOMM precursor leader peptide-binding protein, partial [Myxococcota bacterium]
PWLLTKPSGMVLWIGPLIRPGQTACWQCLEQRLRINRQVERYMHTYATPVDRPDGRGAGKLAPSPASLTAGISLAATEIVKALVVAPSHALDNTILTCDLASLDWVEHTLVKRPQCSACGPIDLIEAQPITLHSRPKVHPTLSGHRSALPEQTFAKYEHHISPITGVVTHMTPRPDGSGLVNNFTAGHHFPLSTDDVGQVQINRFARSGAGGKTIASAKTATLCESIERYSTAFWGDRKLIKATRAELGDDAIDLRQLQLFSDAQYENRVEWNRTAVNSQQFVPELPSEAAEHSWASAWSLTHERFVYLPASYCFYGFQERDCHGVSDSNGVAAGNSLEEAILSGLLELIERDAVALWWYNRIQRPAVDAASFELPYWEKTRVYYRDKLDRELHVLDLTVDTQIPTFAVVSRRAGWPVEDVTLGFASHLDSQTALLRALGGTNQYLPALATRAADGNTSYRFVDPETLAWFKTATYDSHPYLAADPAIAPRSRRDLPQLAGDDIRDDLVRCIAILKELGLEVLVVDLTRPDVGLPVARVAVPGLRHFWRRLAPGRLYDVPVKLGWLASPLQESEMNPTACFV